MHESLTDYLETEFNLLTFPKGTIAREFCYTFYSL